MLSPEALARGINELELVARASESCALHAEYGTGPTYGGRPDMEFAQRHATSAAHLRACIEALRSLMENAR